MSETSQALLPDPDASMEVSPEKVMAWTGLDPESRPMLIDCREADELMICRIPGHEWIPLREIPHRMEAIRSRSARGVVVYCHHGMRSLHAAEFLRGHGISNAFSMHGGIDLWSQSVDPTVARY